MLNSNKLRGRMVELGVTTDDAAKALGIHRSTFYRKLSGEKQFTVGEADRLVCLLHLSAEDAKSIFFSTVVA